jgi:hypothetical protein
MIIIGIISCAWSHGPHSKDMMIIIEIISCAWSHGLHSKDMMIIIEKYYVHGLMVCT